MKQKNIQYQSNFADSEPEFYMHIDFEAIKDIKLSIAHRALSNRGSGLIRHPLRWCDRGDPVGIRVIEGVEMGGVYGKNKKDARLFHDSYQEHIEALGLGKGADFVVVSNGNLGNNYWHIAWEYDKDKQLYCLEKEPFEDRKYSCFVVPRELEKERPYIKNVRVQEYPDVSEPCEPPYPDGVFDRDHKDLTENIAWCTSGQQIVRGGAPLPLEEIVDQFYDVKHVLDLLDYPDERKGGKERMDRDMATMRELYRDYPEKFREKMLAKLKEGFPRARYYHSTLGLDGQGIVLYHKKGTIEEIAKGAVGKGVQDMIILDQGGSVGLWASWLYPAGGFLTTSSYFRDDRISVIGFVLK